MSKDGEDEKKVIHNSNLEEEFLSDDQCRISVFVGIKGSSKTYTILHLLKKYIDTHRYTRYYLIFPSYLNDNDQEQYEFLRQVKDKNIKIKLFTKYSPSVIKTIMKERKKDEKENALLIIDDSTDQGVDLSKDKNFIHIITTSRHIKLAIHLVTHTLKKVLSPVVRNNIDYLFTYRIVNKTLLESLYDELFSSFPDWTNFKDFSQWYFKNILKVQYTCIFLNCLSMDYDYHVKDWKLMNPKATAVKNIKAKPAANIKVQEVDAEKDFQKEKIIQQLQYAQMKQDIKEKQFKDLKFPWEQ